MKNIVFLILSIGAISALGMDAGEQYKNSCAQVLLASSGNFHDSKGKKILTGAVVTDTGMLNDDYINYFWVRDSAMAHDFLLLQLIDNLDGTNINNKNVAIQQMLNFSDLARNLEHNKVLGKRGEPKWSFDGSPYSGRNATPQDDGPAARALLIGRLADYLLQTGEHNDKQTAFKLLEKGNTLQEDLKYLEKVWGEKTHDLWEQFPDHFLDTRVKIRSAFAKAAQAYSEAAKHTDTIKTTKTKRTALKKTFLAMEQRNLEIAGRVTETVGDSHQNGHFWNGEDHYKFSLDSKKAQEWNFDYSKNIDVSIILSANFSQVGDGIFPITDPKLQSTFHELNKAFKNKKTYLVNRMLKKAGSVLWGRYPGDSWNGSSRGEKAGPWIIATAGAAEYLARNYIWIKRAGEFTITPTNRAFFEQSVLLKNHKLENKTYKKGSAKYTLVLNALLRNSQNTMDELIRITNIGKSNSQWLPEQVNPTVGGPQGPQNLTWSHVAFAKAMHYIDKAKKLK